MGYQLERNQVLGRRLEIEWFELQLNQINFFEFRVLNIYGTGGIGKSTLLEYFHTLTSEKNIPFVFLDSRDFIHTPAHFNQKVLEILNSQFRDNGQKFINVELGLNGLARDNRLILAIDTYEEMLDMDHWLRKSFLPQLSDRIQLILSGRHKLSEEWMTWPYLKNSIHFMPLKAFNFETCIEYAAQHMANKSNNIEHIYAITHGHPLTLSLIMQKPEIIQEFYDNKTNEFADTLKKVSVRWLRELPSSTFQRIIEAASIIRIFNQESLEFMMQDTIISNDFDRLIDLSFIKRSRRGWFIHDGLRNVLLMDFRLRKPAQFKLMQARGMKYIYQQFNVSDSKEDKAILLFELLYLMENQSTVRATFMDESDDHHYYFKTLQMDSIGEMEHYMQKVLSNHADAEKEYVDPQTLERHTLKRTYDFIEKAYNLIDPTVFLTLGEEVIRLLINDKGEASGLIVFLPIHRGSLPILKENPCTKNFFASLRGDQLKALDKDPGTPAGWFLYHVDLIGDSSSASRQVFFQTFMKLLVRGGLFIFSSPIDYFIKVNKELGFEEVPEAGHSEFGENLWSTTLQLDLRGNRLNDYIKRMIHHAGGSLEQVQMVDLSRLTKREREVAQMLLECETNAEIAEKLHITEITVKKHLNQVYKKEAVKNRTEFLKKLIKVKP